MRFVVECIYNLAELKWDVIDVTRTLSSGVSDGDKGDITVTSSGTVWTIDAGSVNHTKLASMTSAQFAGVISDETGTGALVFANTPTLITPILGTPTSGTLTNCTGLPIAGLVASTVTAIGVGSIELGQASDTTITRVSAGVIAVEGVTVPTISSTSTLTNKRITSRVQSVVSSATVTPSADNDDSVEITAQAAALTIAAPTGTPTSHQKLIIRIKDNATARAITWNAIYRAIGVTIPATTVISKTLYLGFIYNLADTKWDCVAVNQEA